MSEDYLVRNTLKIELDMLIIIPEIQDEWMRALVSNLD